jgi:hypothetical protein
MGVDLANVDDDQLGALIREAFRLMLTKNIASAPPSLQNHAVDRG